MLYSPVGTLLWSYFLVYVLVGFVFNWSIKFLLSSNIGEILSVFTGMLLSWESPLCATQLLWVNLITDSLPALSLGVDPVNKDIMSKPPRNPRDGIFKNMWLSIALEGCIIGMLSVIAYCAGRIVAPDNPAVSRTMSFSVLALSQLFHAFNMRSEKSVLNAELVRNRFLVMSLAVGILLQICVVNIPILSDIFKTTPLSLREWGIVMLLSVMPLIIVELQKLFSRK